MPDTTHRPMVLAPAIAVVAAVLAIAVGPEAPPAEARRTGGTLHLSAEVADPKSVITVRGRLSPGLQRRTVLQRSVAGGPWRRVAVGESSRSGRYRFVTTVPGRTATVVRYRVHLPKRRVDGRVRPRRLTSTDALRTTGAAAGPAPTAPAPTAPAPTAPAPTAPAPTAPAPAPTAPAPMEPGGPAVVARWEMDEAAGSTRMVDSSGRGHHGAISPDAAAAGLRLTGTDYSWSVRCRDCPPVALARVVQVPDSPELEIPDPTTRWSLEFRFRTTEAYGNIMQKGQATTAGGQIKVEDAIGLRCVFKGANGSSAVAVGTKPLHDGQWHTVTCVHTATSVSQWVDGVRVAHTSAATGRIDNGAPFVIGGKTLCDQKDVGCDYFSGSVDWTRITLG